ncbi:CheR family methyltransferase [Tundrisphaera lichenicola]|uniref:CheR family methyltransferase n=1 Tax=Tundrisphaera lichenicola TaxID=2029860 RepID=UPI003EC00941
MHGGDLSEEVFAKFRALIYKAAGIQIPETKKVMVSNRLRRRLRATGIAGFPEYYTFLTSIAGVAEMPLFLNEITTNETYFYRDVHHFDWLSESFFPGIAEQARLRKRPRTLRIWSAASSTGEELYSIAMRFLPFRSQFAGWKLTFLGTDLSGAALEAARIGTYDERAVRLVGQADRSRYFDFDPKAQRWTVKDEVKSLATWRSHNLLRPLNEEPFDCVFIKNVLIYFDVMSKQAVTKHLINSVAKGGYLVVGPTEGIYNMLEPLEKRQAWLYQRANS